MSVVEGLEANVVLLSFDHVHGMLQRSLGVSHGPNSTAMEVGALGMIGDQGLGFELLPSRTSW